MLFGQVLKLKFNWVFLFKSANLTKQLSLIQVAIVPCGITVNLKDEERSGLYAACKEYEDALVEAGVRVKGDYRENYSPGDHVIETTLQRLGW